MPSSEPMPRPGEAPPSDVHADDQGVTVDPTTRAGAGSPAEGQPQVDPATLDRIWLMLSEHDAVSPLTAGGASTDNTRAES